MRGKGAKMEEDGSCPGYQGIRVLPSQPDYPGAPQSTRGHHACGSHPLPVAWLSHSSLGSRRGLGGVSGVGPAAPIPCKAAHSFLEPGAKAEPEPGNQPPHGAGASLAHRTRRGLRRTHAKVWEAGGGGHGRWAQGGEAGSGVSRHSGQGWQLRGAAPYPQMLPGAIQGPNGARRDEAAPAPSHGWARPWRPGD